MTKVSLPRDANNYTSQLTPATLAKQVTYDATISSSTNIQFDADTSYIEVAAIDKPILMSWGASTASTTNFDEIILPGQVREFFVPDGISSASFIEQAASAILVCIEK